MFDARQGRTATWVTWVQGRRNGANLVDYEGKLLAGLIAHVEPLIDEAEMLVKDAMIIFTPVVDQRL